MSEKRISNFNLNLKGILPENKEKAERFIKLTYGAALSLIKTQGYSSNHLKVKLLEIYTTARGAKISDAEFTNNIRQGVYSNRVDTVIFSTEPPESSTIDTMVLALLVLPSDSPIIDSVKVTSGEKIPVEGLVVVHSSKVSVGDALSVLLKATTIDLDETMNSCILDIDFSTGYVFITEEHNSKLIEYSNSVVVTNTKLVEEDNEND